MSFYSEVLLLELILIQTNISSNICNYYKQHLFWQRQTTIDICKTCKVMEKVSGEWQFAISLDARTRGHLWETHMKKTKGMPISHRAYLNCGASCHSSGSRISHPEEMHVEGVQDMKIFQKGFNDFAEERAHSGTTQSCLDAFSSIQMPKLCAQSWLLKLWWHRRGRITPFWTVFWLSALKNRHEVEWTLTLV